MFGSDGCHLPPNKPDNQSSVKRYLMLVFVFWFMQGDDMQHTELPKDIGGYQHLAPDVVTRPDDIYVKNGKVIGYVDREDEYIVRTLEDAMGMNVYRRIPVAKQGDCDTTGWKSVCAGKYSGLHPELPDAGGFVRASDVLVDRGAKMVGGALDLGAGCNSDVPVHAVAYMPPDGGGAPQSPRPLMPASAFERKSIPIATGFLDYFPRAVAAIASVSQKGNEQHNPGKPLHWDRSKSGDEADALMRHFMERGTIDTDGTRHSAKLAWRALALLEKELENL